MTAPTHSPELRRSLVVPSATYRLQLNASFTFADLERIVPYLHRLGVSHCYLSPYLQARPGSAHGYDVTDHAAINSEIGSRADLERLAATLAAHGMGHIADVVPNHMGVMGADSAWWLDVLENGRASQYAEYFDIDWHPVRPELRDKVLVPVLGDHYGTVLESGELALRFDCSTGSLAIHYHEHLLPLDPNTYPAVLARELTTLAAQLGDEDPDYAEYLSIVHSFEHLPMHRETDEALVAERQREKEVAKRRLAELCARSAPVRALVERNCSHVGGRVGHPGTFAALHEVLERQPWRVAFWQVAADEINYRRFFDVNDLAALRMERRDVFEATHALIANMYRDGIVDGLRIDHPDGLYDPGAYFRDLQKALTGSASDTNPSRTAFVVCEKILAAHEHLRDDWVVQGTTGYDFSALTTGLTVYSPAERAFDRCYRAFTHDHTAFDALLYECKRLVIRVHLSSELTMLANLLSRIAQDDWHTRDFTLNGLRDALTEVVACFPVYRTYITKDEGVADDDRNHVEWAVSWARQHDQGTNPDLYDFIRSRLLLDLPPEMPPTRRLRCERFAMKFQQYTAPVMAKALEDTCFYRHPKLGSLCEVGADPRRFGVSIAAFHHHNRARQRRWPHNLLAGSTHDSKRSEDVRARLNVLTEMPDEWEQRLRRWRRLTRPIRRRLGDAAPTRRDEYLYCQTLIGIWPLATPDNAALDTLADRLSAYMRKAAREAKERTSWMRPDAEYEAGLERFVRESLDPAGAHALIADVDEFARRMTPFGLLNSLVQTALRLTSPGVPDVYQGDELWNFSLVDPDNRRPVSYEHRHRMLDDLVDRESKEGRAALVDALARGIEDGAVKLHVVRTLLTLRAAHRTLFDHGEYVPLGVQGPRAEHVCAFARHHAEERIVVVAARWLARLDSRPGIARAAAADIWRDTTITLPTPTDTLYDALTGQRLSSQSGELRAADLLCPLPVAVLITDSAAACSDRTSRNQA